MRTPRDTRMRMTASQLVCRVRLRLISATCPARGQRQGSRGEDCAAGCKVSSEHRGRRWPGCSNSGFSLDQQHVIWVSLNMQTAGSQSWLDRLQQAVALHQACITPSSGSQQRARGREGHTRRAPSRASRKRG